MRSYRFQVDVDSSKGITTHFKRPGVMAEITRAAEEAELPQLFLIVSEEAWHE